MLSDEAAIANAALAIDLAEHQLPSLFSLAAAWMKRLQSEVEVGPALNALVDRVDLINTGIRVSPQAPELHRGRAARWGFRRTDYRACLPDADQAARVRNASGSPGQSRARSTG
jgi:hypothetical protein